MTLHAQRAQGYFKEHWLAAINIYCKFTTFKRYLRKGMI